MIDTAKATSVTEQGDPDGWTPPAGFLRDLASGGKTQLVVSVPTKHLLSVHVELVRALVPPLSFLYRQVVDRKDPKPQGFPPRDFVTLELPTETVVSALRQHTDLIHHDARCEVWVRGGMGEQIVLDPDGLLYCQPDDPAFRDVLLGNGLPEHEGEESFHTIADRDYVKAWFHGENDVLERQLLVELGLQEVAHRG